MTRLDDQFLKLLACPVTRAPLLQVGEWLYSTDRADPRRYPINDGVPNLLVEASESVSADDFTRVMAEAGRNEAEPPAPETK